MRRTFTRDYCDVCQDDTIGFYEEAVDYEGRHWAVCPTCHSAGYYLSTYRLSESDELVVVLKAPEDQAG